MTNVHDLARENTIATARSAVRVTEQYQIGYATISREKIRKLINALRSGTVDTDGAANKLAEWLK
jgi:hypothetical protein